MPLGEMTNYDDCWRPRLAAHKPAYVRRNSTPIQPQPGRAWREANEPVGRSLQRHAKD